MIIFYGMYGLLIWLVIRVLKIFGFLRIDGEGIGYLECFFDLKWGLG